MNKVIATSRGKGLQRFLPAGTTVSVRGGGLIDELICDADSVLPPYMGQSKRTHLYFVFGIPDITKLLKNFENHHRETIFDEEPSVTSDRILKKIRKCQTHFVERGALPIFCTIPRVNLAKYNLFGLLNNKTSTLNYVNQYATMQENLDQAIDQINNGIYEINKKLQVSTPFLHGTIRERRGAKGKRHTVYRYEKLYDGLHAHWDLRPVWADCLSKAFRLNSLLEDSESEGEGPSRRPQGGWSISTKDP